MTVKSIIALILITVWLVLIFLYIRRRKKESNFVRVIISNRSDTNVTIQYTPHEICRVPKWKSVIVWLPKYKKITCIQGSKTIGKTFIDNLPDLEWVINNNFDAVISSHI